MSRGTCAAGLLRTARRLLVLILLGLLSQSAEVNIGSRVTSLIDFDGSSGTLRKGDEGVIKGPASAANDGRFDVEFPNYKKVILNRKQFSVTDGSVEAVHGLPSQSDEVAMGSVVTSLIDFDGASGTLRKGDRGIIKRPASDTNDGRFDVEFPHYKSVILNRKQFEVTRISSEVPQAGLQAKQTFALPIPRVSVENLRTNATLRSGLHAFVLINFVGDNWKASNWTLQKLREKIPFEWVDFYPYNMQDTTSKPYLYKFEECLAKFHEQTGKPKYMQIRLSLKGWNRIAQDFDPKPLPDMFWDDDSWIRQCMKKEDNGSPDIDAIDNFFVTQQWKFLLIGEKGTSMFFHKDGTAASSWQAQVVGRKTWTLCPNDQSPLLSMHINTYDPDYQRFPQFAQAYCGQVTVNAGEMLYYPAYWWHHTLQLDTPSIAYTGALVGVEADRHDVGRFEKSHVAFYNDLMDKCKKCWTKGKDERRCSDNSLKWPGAAPPVHRTMCEVYLPQCLKIWDKHASSLHMQASKTSEL